MDKNEVLKKVEKDILEHMAGYVEEDDVTPESELVNDLGMDSLDIVEIAMDLEDIFDIEFTEESLYKLPTVEDIAKYIIENISD